MPSNFRIDHIVILVDDLEIAIENYRELGFIVTPGGQHPAWGSHNALIALAGGCYLELIAFRSRQPDAPRVAKETLAEQLLDEDRTAVECRVLAWAAPSAGLVDFALLPADTDRDIVQARQHGLDIEGPFPGSRNRPDGQTARWQLGIPSTFDVPFLCGDVTDRSLRVPAGQAVQHPNGVTGINRLLVAVTDLDDTILRYRALLGEAPRDGLRPLPKTRTVRFDLAGIEVALYAPLEQSSPIQSVLISRGQGPFAMDLTTATQALAGPLDPVLTNGAHINLGAKEP